uniref:Kinesin motor domain-containing protein n=1 Tax=Ananas comosus var. bracteatus TaxID=296719 RepID=A0A6V7NS69_ANACO|nr:unnamed protein product [Ananas comosus var. bracteatus]
MGRRRSWRRRRGGGGGGDGRRRRRGSLERILVSVRLRPLNAKEKEKGDASDWECINNTTIIFKNSLPDRSMLPAAYSFDRVFGCECATRQVYEEGAKEVALSVVSGINSSIFAYGQTSSGKTYTMTGITEYSVADIYDYIQKHAEREFILKFSAMEIYNEAVRDLLSADTTPLRLLDDPEKGTVVDKLTEETLRDQDHLRELLAVCEAQRQNGETSLNEMSSRSHQILRLTIESSAREFFGKDSSSTLAACVNFVDLAGSERASQALSAGVRLKEGCHINRSLLTLGTVIRKLSKGRNGHIPYRDSKLTRILQPSLGGNARTAIICTMSPARSHIEQSRNTLLFASCAKEVATNAQVNVVMSDKALVKHLQRELTRLESELKYPGSASCTIHSEALRERDAQIRKMEKEMKELMQQRDLVQSRLEDLLRSVGDDHDRNSRRWDELSQSSISHVREASEDAFSTSETYGIAYQDQDLGSAMFDHLNSRNIRDEHNIDHTENPNKKQANSPTHSISSSRASGKILYQRQEDCEDQCKEVQCIEINKLSRGKSEDFNLLFADESDSLLPLTDADKLEHHEQKHSVGTDLSSEHEEQQSNTVTKNVDNFVKPTPNESSMVDANVSKPKTIEPLHMESNNMNSKVFAVTRSRSCRASLMMTSTCFEDSDLTNNRTPPDSYFRDYSGRTEAIRRSLFSPNYNNPNDRFLLEGSQASEKFSHDEMIKAEDISTNSVHSKIDANSEEGVSIIGSYVEGQKEISENQYLKQLPDDQYSRRTTPSEDFGVEITVKDVGVDPVLSSLSESPSRCLMEFERKQQEIIDLWHACNVSLVHRTYFFLLFKGDPSDSIYLEVEHRRLSFLRNSFSSDLAKQAAEGELNGVVASSLKNLRREREMLYRQMLKKLPEKERESLYNKWGIALNSKQRRLQLARCVWTKTDMEHVRESASLVARLIGLLEPGQALKEMFGLSFTLAPQLTNRRSLSWKPGMSFT